MNSPRSNQHGVSAVARRLTSSAWLASCVIAVAALSSTVLSTSAHAAKPAASESKPATAASPSATAAHAGWIGDKDGEYRYAVFAGGCFWCTEADFEALPGVVEAISGYAGGAKPNPTYEEVSRGNSGHIEVVKVIYNPAKVRYADLVEFYWKTVDPTVSNRQFCDVGPQYRTAIFVSTAEQQQLAQASRDRLVKSGVLPTVTTEILPLKAFYDAEDYHQDYYKTNPIRYKYYRNGCGRDARLKEVWKTR